MKHVEFGGGLGDTITLMYTSDRYNSLERLEQGEQATVVCMSHNPYIPELFLWHPKRDQLTVRDVGFWWPNEDAEKRVQNKLPPAQPFVHKVQETCEFYPSPRDFEVLKEVWKPFVIMAAAAGGIDRNVPAHLCEKFADQAIAHGYRVVVIGRTYGKNRSEIHLRTRDKVINLVDRLTIPGTAFLMKHAAGVFAAHSGMCLLSWYMRKPTFLIYPPHVRQTHFHSVHQYTFGKDYENCRHMLDSEFTPNRVDEFFDVAISK